MKTYLLVAKIILFGIINPVNHVQAQPNLDSIFVKWNKLTFLSISKQGELASDTSQKKYYANRLESVKSYLEVNDSLIVNSKSIRYEFLKTLFLKNTKKKSDFYLVESNKSGYKVSIRNFVVYVDSLNSIKIDYYSFSDGSWNLVESKMLNNCIIEDSFDGYVAKFWKGFNADDVIITKFKNGELVASYFYLFYTLSSKSCFKNFL